MPTVLSLQSRVAYGHVGNAAAVFPLQRLGCETWTLDTVAFSNHTGHGRWRGSVVPAGEVASIFEGIAELGVLPRCDAVLSGYLGAPATGAVLLDILARVRAANPNSIYCCDPVIGDTDTGQYVAAGIPEFFRDRLLRQAEIATPNRFELDLLTGHRVGNLVEAVAAANALRAIGPAIVLVTSLDFAPDAFTLLAAGPEGAWAVETPRLPVVLNGCGDVAAALFLARLLRGEAVADALAATAAAMFGVIETTMRLDRHELALVTAQEELVAPKHKFMPQPVAS